MPRVTKTKAPVVATPRRATRSTVRAGSASLEEPIEVPAPRRRSSRSKTPESKNSSFEKSHLEPQLPALAEEEEKQSPRVVLPAPSQVAPIADASPYVTPSHYHIASTRNPLYVSPSASRSAQQSPAASQSSPTVSQLVHQSPAGSRSVQQSPTVSQLIHQSPTVSKTVQQSVEIYIDDDQAQDDHETQNSVVVEDDQEEEEEEAVQAAVESQLANETAEAGLSHSHPISPALKTPHPASLAGRSSTKRRRSARSGGFPRTPTFDNSTLYHSPLGEISGNIPAWKEFFPSSLFDSSSPQRSPASPAFASISLMDRAIKNEEILPELTDRQRTALLIDMRREIVRLRKVEEQFLAASKQAQPSAKSSPQQPAVQQPSPDIPRTINRIGDLRYHRSIATPARKRLLAQREAEAAAAAAAEAEQAAKEQAASEEQQITQTPSHSSPSPSEHKRKSKTPQSSPSEAQTPQRSSQNSESAQTPAAAASPAWGLTSLFGSVKSIFTHRPSFSPVKQLQEQPQEQRQEQQPEQSQQAQQQPQFTPSPSKKQRRILSSSQQSPTPKPRTPAPPATPAPAPEEAEDDGLYGQTPRTTRRRGVLPGSMPRRKRDAPSKPKETNADLRASQLEVAAQKTVERERAEEKAARLERERREIVEELKKRDAAYNVGDKRKINVNVDDLAVIPRKAKGAGSGTYGLVDEFFEYDEASDFVEMDEDEVQLRSASEHPTKRIRLDENVFQPKTPAPQPTVTSPVKAAPQPPAIPATPTPNYSQLAQQAIEKQRLQFSKHQPQKPSRLRQVQRQSNGSTVDPSSPQQPITAPQDTQEVGAPIQDIQEVAAPIQETQEVATTAQVPETAVARVFKWPELGPSMETPETWAKIDKIYTPELKALDHAYFMKKFEAAMANSQ
ncbi:unnamed protein product [Aureobasidium mustum]|uniref:Uncharacterized protein n=2 Tax=Aureobasidium TaxID=5579 RepID=A0A9N8PMV1_9PEZI|nr:unnamed protein product [Aureobasidium mustum]